jgi:hypothetical protein
VTNQLAGNVSLMEVIEHAHEVAQAAGQLVEFPDDQRVAVLQRLEATEQGRALGGGSPVRSCLKIFWHPVFFRAVICKAEVWSSADTRA